MSDKRFVLTDPTSGKEAELPVREGSVGPASVDIGTLYKQHGIFTYDPGFVSTASCSSAVTYIDGEQGILLYRGYPVDQLAEKSTFIEVAYLLLHGDLPTAAELEDFRNTIQYHTMIKETLKYFFRGFQRAPDGDAVFGGRVAVRVLPRHDRHLRRRRP